MLDSLLDLLQQIDLSALGDLSEIDWTNVATYGALTIAFVGVIWTTTKNFIKFLWQKTEGLVGFLISTLVVIALWYTLLRVHVSISFNLDKEVFDDLLWLSTVLFTPYYLIHYNLLTGVLLTGVRSLELLLDLLVFSWFPNKAEKNRQKWRTRINTVYTTWKEGMEDFFQQGRSAVQVSPTPFELNSVAESEDSEGQTEDTEKTEGQASA